ncbi:MAG: Rieske 2Fe-2S family protein [Gammaproteobacteria bacterium]|jgi:Rieske 2Fe-2S family protein
MSTSPDSVQTPESRLPDWANKRPVSERYPHVDMGPVSIQPYVSEEFFELEREKIFKKMWLYVGRTERIPNEGDHFTQVIEAVRTKKEGTYPSFIICRDKNGEVRAFHNACQHRGTTVVWDNHDTWATNNRKYFACRFHGWVYDTDGSLKFVPDENQFCGLNKTERGLRPVQCAVWKGFIFINVDPNPSQTLEEQIKPHADLLKDFPFEKIHKRGIWTAVVDVNWKVAMDAFQEGYHVNTVHASTLPEAFNGALNPNCRPTSIRLFEQGNRSVTFMVSPDFEPPAVEKWVRQRGSSWYAAGGAETGNEFPGTNPDNDPFYAFDCHGFFPNMLVDPYVGGFYGHEFWPISVNKTRWIGSINFAEPEKPSDLIVHEHGKTLLRDAFREDTVTLDATQVGLESGAIETTILSDGEMAPRHVYNAVVEMVNS